MLSRRGFVLAGAAVGGGMIFAWTSAKLDDGDAAKRFAAEGKAGAPLNAWLKISSSGEITCAIHRAEMGQGVTTSLAMLLIEELDANWDDVRFEFAPVDKDYFNFGMLLRGQPLGDPEASWMAGTGTWAIRQVFHALGMSMTISSSSVVDGWDTLRNAGATARAMLVAAAAQRWRINEKKLTTDAGWVINPENGDRLGYGELAEQASQQTPKDAPRRKDPASFRLIGRNPLRLDTRQKITGQARFGIDVKDEKMLFAAIVHSPVAGTSFRRYSATDATDMPGIRAIVPAGKPGAEHAVAVVADNTWQALQAAQRITLEPDIAAEDRVNTADIVERYRTLSTSGNAVEFYKDETFDAFNETRPTTMSAEYFVPYLAHMCMEPMNCTAYFTGDSLEIWAPTQANSIARDLAAELCELKPEQVTLRSTFMGGGFGRRAEMDFIEQAVSVAKQLPGKPVKLMWSREQDVRHDAFRPAAFARLTGSVNDSGRPAMLDFELVTQSVVASYEERTPTPRGGEAETDGSVVTTVNPALYPFENRRIRYVPAPSHVPVGYWRSVSHSWNTFFLESFIDELAIGANVSPLEFRRRALSEQPRHSAVLNELENLSANLVKPGFAIAESHGSIVAHAIEINVDNDAQFKSVNRVICVVDCGPVIHPDNVRAQMEGSVIDGLSAALFGQIDIDDGIVRQGNFNDYRRLRMSESPAIEVSILSSTAPRPGGIGEPGVPGVAPALTNAIFANTGQRIRTLPILGRSDHGSSNIA